LYIESRPRPRTAGSAVAFQCEAYARYEGEDHEIFVGKIVSLDEEDGARGAGPLVFHSRKFRALAEEQAHTPASDAVYLHGW
jgi:flavin reductase (DIM6/NTAB) family NADH-FMN oxidoreductase RutF